MVCDWLKRNGQLLASGLFRLQPLQRRCLRARRVVHANAARAFGQLDRKRHAEDGVDPAQMKLGLFERRISVSGLDPGNRERTGIEYQCAGWIVSCSLDCQRRNAINRAALEAHVEIEIDM